MKKIIASLILAVLLVLSLPFLVLAQDMQNLTDSHGRYVDIVIIVDHSRSMETLSSGAGNDPKGNRYIASAMITAMCDMNGSRVAFVPFAKELNLKGNFVDLNSFYDAEALRSQISTYASRSVQGSTDYGSALAYAYNLFATRDDETKLHNNPIIILLTDGDNDLSTGYSGSNLITKDYTYLWNSATNLYEEVPYSRVRNIRKSTNLADDDYFKNLVYYDGTPVTDLSDPTVLNAYDDNAADMLVYDVAIRCQQENIPIYTIPLYNSAERSAPFIGLLQQISQMTDALSNPVSSRDADRLPFFFGDVFADQIGSSQRLLNVRPTDEDGLFEVDIPILNRSVQEANIYIPLTYVDAGSIRLIDSDGRERIPDNNEIIRITYSNTFVFYKLRATTPLGNWHLQFRTKSTDVPPSSINFSLLYNYDITLTSTVNGTSSGLSLSKSGTLDLISSFYDNKTQTQSTDTHLYEVRDEEEDTIRFTYRLLDSNSQELEGVHSVAGQMTLDAATLSMKATVDLRDYDLSSGDYYIQIVADGAGLHRENLVPITLENAAPVAHAQLRDSLNVEYLDDQSTYSPQSRDFDLRTYIDDSDGDALSFAIPQFTSGDGILTMTVNGPTLTIGTQADTSTGHYLYGLVTGTIDVTDDDHGTCQLDFSITVNSGWAAAQDCDYPTTVTGLISSDVADKNSDISFSMTPVNRVSGTPQGISLLTGRILLIDAASGQELAVTDMAPNDTDDALEGIIRTANTAANWIARCEYLYNGEVVSSEDVPINVSNTPPQALSAEDAAPFFPKELTYNASIYASFANETNEVSVDLGQIFSDANNESGLIYEVALDNADDVNKLSCRIDESNLILNAISAGKIAFTVTAKDGDGESVPFHYTIRVANLFVRWTIRLLILLLAIVVFILLLLAIRQRNKPRFSEAGSLHVTIGSSLFDRNSQPDFSFNKLHKPKNPITLNSVITLDTSDVVQFKHAELGNIRLRPVKGSNELRVEMTKKNSSFIVKLDDNDANLLRMNNPIILHDNHELTLYHEGENDSENCVHVLYSLSGSMRESSSFDDSLSFIPDFSGSVSGADLPMDNAFDGIPGNDFNTGLDAGFDSGIHANFSGRVDDNLEGSFDAIPNNGFSYASDTGADGEVHINSSGGADGDFEGGFGSSSAGDFGTGFGNDSDDGSDEN